MLESTFIHVPGVGPKTERKLWDEGWTTWERFRGGYGGSRRSWILPFLNTADVRERLPKNELWRLYPQHRERTVFLDIETTGYNDDVTCVGIYDGRQARTFVRGRDLAEFPEAMRDYEMVVTFNGSQFDLPILGRVFPVVDFGRMLHVDLRFALRRLGLRGGLKKIERELGLNRGALDGVDGWAAVVLWRLHRQGHPRALATLEAYNLEDVVNLEPLLCHLYNEEIAHTPLGLPLLETQPRPYVEPEADTELVEWLLGQVPPAWGA
jgi:uncharacterized protein YprB with RNaseH-like and TPR domain